MQVSREVHDIIDVDHTGAGGGAGRGDRREHC